MDKMSYSRDAAENWHARLAARLLAAPPPPLPMPQAAVLVPIVMREDPILLFTLRSDSLPRHPGQISFPGGLAEEGEPDPANTALRELEEETGITADFVTLAGYLRESGTASGFCIRPVVGLVREGYTLTLDAREVAGIVEVPLSFFLDPANTRICDVEWQGAWHRVLSFDYGESRIWGATASIAAELAQRLRA